MAIKECLLDINKQYTDIWFLYFSNECNGKSFQDHNANIRYYMNKHIKKEENV